MFYILGIVIDWIKKIPYRLYYFIIDTYKYYKNKEYEKFNLYGLYIYVGMFGSSKTISITRRAKKLAKRYKNLKILTNYQLYNFPKHTEIIPLKNFQQIIDVEGDTLILIDEISSIFNSRNWAKGGIPYDLIGLLLQVRKQRKVIFATAQIYKQVDALLRQITYEVVECSTVSLGVSRRLVINKHYDAFEYEQTMDTYGVKPMPLRRFTFIQTDELRKSYDTMEMIDKAKKQEFLSSKEILEKQGITTGTVLESSVKKIKTIKRK